MEEDLKNHLDIQQQLLQQILKSTEKTRKYFLWTLIVTVAVLVLPLIGLMFAIPKFLDVYLSQINGI